MLLIQNGHIKPIVGAELDNGCILVDDNGKIAAIGKDIAGRYGISFLDRDFKKQDGFKRSIELSKKYGLYRQDYCGCVYSDWRSRK